jgi:predicted transcriptional regulator
MGPQCEIIGKYVLPIFRSMLAKELVQTYHLSQTETAKKLGTTQAAISQYLSSKRAYKGMDHVEEFLPQIQTLATDIAKKIVNREIGAGDVTPHFCDLCTTFCKKTPTTKAAKPENNS